MIVVWFHNQHTAQEGSTRMTSSDMVTVINAFMGGLNLLMITYLTYRYHTAPTPTPAK
jgi:hypothetical protein